MCHSFKKANIGGTCTLNSKAGQKYDLVNKFQVKKVLKLLSFQLMAIKVQ